MKIFVVLSLALGGTLAASAQEPAQLKFSRVVDLTLPIESNMPGIPGLKSYADNPSRVSIIAAITEAQKELLRAEGMTLSNTLVVNGRSMISISRPFFSVQASTAALTWAYKVWRHLN